jgi:diketogulonate reductase-like aldo/keto reductase
VCKNFNLADRKSLPILHECVVREIAFVPFCPLGWPRLQHEQIRTDPAITGIAQAHGGTPAQIALAWLLALAPNVLLIPGTSKHCTWQKTFKSAPSRCTPTKWQPSLSGSLDG